MELARITDMPGEIINAIDSYCDLADFRKFADATTGLPFLEQHYRNRYDLELNSFYIFFIII